MHIVKAEALGHNYTKMDNETSRDVEDFITSQQI